MASPFAPPLDLALDELRSFVVLAAQRHFGRAARLLGVSQPALSKRLRRLEDTVGGPLLVRGYRDVSLTETGRVLLAHGQTLLAAAERAVSLARAAGRGEVGRLRVGFGIASAATLLPETIGRFRRAHPGVQLELHDMHSHAQLQALAADELDLGFPRLPVSDPALATLAIVHQRLDAVTAPQSAWRDRTGLRSLAEAPFVLCSRAVSAGYQDHVLALCRSAGFAPRVVTETNDLFSLLQLVRAGIGVALVPSATAAMRVPGVRYHRVTLADAAWDIALAWRKRPSSPLVDAFVTTARAVAGERDREHRLRPPAGHSKFAK